ncbi:hypothetical protein LZ31DRAFT_84295 [Colletotrichum somersetense]|nr:hypothetical protein LZ31DRAFT_84295 [Colletotrichum somersetense]
MSNMYRLLISFRLLDLLYPLLLFTADTYLARPRPYTSAMFVSFQLVDLLLHCMESHVPLQYSVPIRSFPNWWLQQDSISQMVRGITDGVECL